MVHFFLKTVWVFFFNWNKLTAGVDMLFLVCFDLWSHFNSFTSSSCPLTLTIVRCLNSERCKKNCCGMFKIDELFIYSHSFMYVCEWVSVFVCFRWTNNMVSKWHSLEIWVVIVSFTYSDIDFICWSVGLFAQFIILLEFQFCTTFWPRPFHKRQKKFENSNVNWGARTV